MLSSRPPHYSRDRKKMLHDIVDKDIHMQSQFTKNAADLLKRLLDRNPNHRIGSGKEGADEIR